MPPYMTARRWRRWLSRGADRAVCSSEHQRWLLL